MMQLQQVRTGIPDSPGCRCVRLCATHAVSCC